MKIKLSDPVTIFVILHLLKELGLISYDRRGDPVLLTALRGWQASRSAETASRYCKGLSTRPGITVATKAIIDLELRTWTRNRTKVTLAAAAKAASVTPEVIEAWEAGTMRRLSASCAYCGKVSLSPCHVLFTRAPIRLPAAR